MNMGLKLTTVAFAGALSLLGPAASAQDIKLPETMTFTAYDTGSSGFNIAVAVEVAPSTVRPKTEYVWAPGEDSCATQTLPVLEQPFHV